MGNKTNPIGVRLVVRGHWEDAVFARGRDYAEAVYLNHKVKAYLATRYRACGMISSAIKQEGNAYVVVINTDDVDAFFASAGQSADEMADALRFWFWPDASLSVRRLDDAASHPVNIAFKLMDDVATNSTVKASVKQVAKALVGTSVAGIKASYAGRIYGVDIAQTVWHIEGRIPLHTLAADVRYASVSTKTNYGVCNVKVWVCANDPSAQPLEAQEAVQGQAEAEV